MTDGELKIKCLELGQSGTPAQTLENAKLYYEWVAEKPKRKPRQPKQTEDILEGL